MNQGNLVLVLFLTMTISGNLLSQMPGKTTEDALAILQPFVLEKMLTDSDLMHKNHFEQMAYVTPGHMKRIVFNKDYLPALALKVSENHDTERTSYVYDHRKIMRINTVNAHRKPVQQIVFHYDSTGFLLSKEVRHFASTGEHISTYHTYTKRVGGVYEKCTREQLTLQFVTLERFDSENRLILRTKLQGKMPYSVERATYLRDADTLWITTSDSMGLLPSKRMTILYDSLERPVVVHCNVLTYDPVDLIEDRDDYEEEWYTLLIGYLPNGMPGRVFRDGKPVLQSVYQRRE